MKKTPKDFFKKFFNLDVENPAEIESKIILPMPKILTCNKIYQAMQTVFSCHSWYGDNIDSVINIQQERPQEDYLYAFKDNYFLDNEHFGKSYYNFCNDEKFYMIPKEGMLAYLYYFYKTGNMMDVNSVTCLHALDLYGSSMIISSGNDGRFYIGLSNPKESNNPREVEVF